jgi:hypothetical protein
MGNEESVPAVMEDGEVVLSDKRLREGKYSMMNPESAGVRVTWLDEKIAYENERMECFLRTCAEMDKDV